ncbi:hypothetical protein ACWCYY_13740 [Kitasatospora sp. NPDC001664]
MPWLLYRCAPAEGREDVRTRFEELATSVSVPNDDGRRWVAAGLAIRAVGLRPVPFGFQERGLTGWAGSFLYIADGSAGLRYPHT